MGSVRTEEVLGDRQKRRLFWVDVLVRLFREKPLGAVGGVIVLVMLLTGIFADIIAPYGVNEYTLADSLLAPSGKYLLGTDNLGRDLFSRIVFGARISMIVGVVASAIDVTVGTVIGILSGFLGGKIDMVVQRFVDAWMCFPGLFIILTIMALLGAGMLQVILVLGVSSGIRSSRVVRSSVIAIKENVYVSAAKAIGCSNTKMLARHILPNIMAPLIVLFTVAMGGMILAEASISFLGFGIPPPTPSWGGMLSGAGRRFMLQAPWMAIWPGLALSVAVYGMNMLGDAVRDLLDPRLRGGVGRYGRVKAKKREAKTDS